MGDDLLFGLGLTVVGMGTVFLLLAALMGLLLLLGRLDRPAPSPAMDPGRPPTAAVGGDVTGTGAALTGGATATDLDEADLAPTVRVHAHGLTDDQVAAIAVAVTRHAELRRRQAAPETRRFSPGSQLHTSRWVSLGRSAQTRPTSRS